MSDRYERADQDMADDDWAADRDAGADFLPLDEDPLAARLVALDILVQVLERRQPLDQTLDTTEDFYHLAPRDRAFARMMIATTLRRMGQIDDMIRRASDRAEPLNPARLMQVLRLGVAQIAFMAVPDYAVVDTAVQMAEAVGLGRQKGLVNAVLRRVAREHDAWLAGQDEARMNMPDWLLTHWIADYGLRTAAEIAGASLVEAPLDITIKDPARRAEWQEVLEAVILPNGSLRRVAGGNVQNLPGFDEGGWWVQDAAAALPARLFGDVKGQFVIDLCAAPGGKTAQLAAQGADVLAVDRSVRRLHRLEENMQRLQLQGNVRVEAADATVWKPRVMADGILLDAPCTATGTIRRHPDVLHLKTPVDMQKLAGTQARLLDNAVTMLKTGGVLIYCTCSLQKAEGEAQIDAFLARQPSMARLPVDAQEIGGMDMMMTPDGDVRVLPSHLTPHGGMDGFYMARLVKN